MNQIRGGFSGNEGLPDENGDDCTNHEPPSCAGSTPPESCPLNGTWPGNPGSLQGPHSSGFQPYAGDPVAISQGTVFKHVTDVSLPVRGDLFFGVTRVYDEGLNSNTAGPDIPVGRNWRLSPDLRLFAAAPNDDLILRDHMGRLRFFQPDTDFGDGSELYYSQLDQGLYAHIERTGTQHYDITYNGGIQHRLLYNGGRLDRITDPNGNRLDFTYDAVGRLASMGNSADSRQLKFEYIMGGGFDGNLHQITDSAGTPHVTYTYSTVSNPFDPGSPFEALTTVTYRQDRQVSYDYTTYHTPGGPSDFMQQLRMDAVLDSQGRVLFDYEYEGDVQEPDLPRPEIKNAAGEYLLDYITSSDGYYQQTYDLYDSDAPRRATFTENWARDVLRVVEDQSLSTSITYLSAGGEPGSRPSQRLIEVREDASGRRNTYSYDTVVNGTPPTYSGYSDPWDHFRHGNCLAVVHGDGSSDTYAYSADDFNTLTSTGDRFGRHTRYTHDSSGNLTTVLYPDGAQSTYAYDAHGQVTSTVDRTGLYSSYVYGATGRAIDMRDGQGRHAQVLSMAEYGDPAVLRDFTGNLVTFTYDSAGRLEEMLLADGGSSTWGYDVEGNLTSERSPRGHVTTYAYDRYGRLMDAHDPAGGITRFGYDRAGNLTTFTDARANDRGYDYDTRGRLIAVHDAAGNQSTYAYDDEGCTSCGAGGVLTSCSNFRGEVTRYDYDSDGNLASAVFDDGERVTYVFDAATGLLADVADSRLTLGNGTLQCDYDSAGRLARVFEPEGAVTSYTYDEFGRRVSVIDPDGNVTSHVYDSYGRLSRIHNGFGQATTRSYDPYGRLATEEYWNGTITTRGYDVCGRVTDLVIREADGDVAQRFQYVHDLNGNVSRTTFPSTWVGDNEDIPYMAYTYDALDRLIEEDWRTLHMEEGEISADTRRWQRHYVYDTVGNRTALGYDNGPTTSTTTYQYDELNQLTSHSAAGGPYRIFSYDAAGNMTARREASSGAGAGNGWTYEWSRGDRLIGVAFTLDEKVGVDSRTTFAYDAAGRRLLRQDDDGTWTRYFYDGLNVLLERESETDPANWAETLLIDCDDGTTSAFAIWDNSPTGSTLVNEWSIDRRSRVVAFNTASGTNNGARTSGSWNDLTGPVLTFQRRGGTGADIRIWTSTSVGTRTFQLATWVGSPSYSGGWCSLPLPSGHNDGEWYEFSLDLQGVLDNLDSGTTLNDIDYIEWRGEADYDTVRVGDARTTRVYTLTPSALGGIISIRELEGDNYYDVDNTDLWYHCDHLGNVALTSNASGVSNGLRWQGARGNQLASAMSGAWASAANAEGYGHRTRSFDGDVALHHLPNGWYDSSLAQPANSWGIHSPDRHFLAARPPGTADTFSLGASANEPLGPPRDWPRWAQVNPSRGSHLEFQQDRFGAGLISHPRPPLPEDPRPRSPLPRVPWSVGWE